MPRRKRGRRPRRLRAERGDPDLPDHPGIADGGALRRLVGGREAEPVGQGPGRRRDAVRSGCRRRAPRRAPERRSCDNVHGEPGAPPDDPEHVQDRRRADPGRDPRRGPHRRNACPLDLRRPQRCHARTDDRLGDARGRLGPGGARPRARGARRHVPGPDPVPPLLRRLPNLARDQQDRDARARRHPGPGPRRRRARLPRPGHDTRRPCGPRHRPEPGRLLPGPRGLQPVLPRRSRHRRAGDGRARHTDGPAVRARRLPRRPGRGPRRHRHGLGDGCGRGDRRRPCRGR